MPRDLARRCTRRAFGAVRACGMGFPPRSRTGARDRTREGTWADSGWSGLSAARTDPLHHRCFIIRTSLLRVHREPPQPLASPVVRSNRHARARLRRSLTAAAKACRSSAWSPPAAAAASAWRDGGGGAMRAAAWDRELCGGRAGVAGGGGAERGG
jgi:hypothetical protein